MALGDLSRAILRKTVEAYIVHGPDVSTRGVLEWAAPLLKAEAATSDRPIDREYLVSIIDEIKAQMAYSQMGSMMVVLGQDLDDGDDNDRRERARRARAEERAAAEEATAAASRIDDRFSGRRGTVEHPIDMLPLDSAVDDTAPPREAAGRSARRKSTPKTVSRRSRGDVPEAA
jgi:hypothetical protein